MTEADSVVMKLKQRLLADRKRIEEELRTLVESESSESAGESMGELSMYDNHPADVATETFEREKNEALIRNAETILKRINMALESMEKGTYGVCRECNEHISPERLEVLPYAVTCMTCQERSERKTR
jgi:YteA family regulatory protein